MNEIEKRTNTAIAAIKKTLDTKEDGCSVTLFISHHLEEIKSDYWQKHLGTSKPAPESVLNLLILRSHWGNNDSDEDGIDIFDFTLPDEITHYVISVQFNEAGEVEKIIMES